MAGVGSLPGPDDVVLPCDDLDEAVGFFTTRLGFRLDMTMPADDPVLAVMSGQGRRVRLERRPVDGSAPLTIASDPPLVVPDLAPAFELTRSNPGDTISVGRAGMHYRDILPSRQGGRFIASHITIPAGGPVPDEVHHHRIRFQCIYCVRGWVRLVYEDQGPPFVLSAGNCVLQPPGIRHRVLESSPGLEVVEVTCPAEHATFLDHELPLPTPTTDRRRCFGDQRFVHHRAADAVWGPWRSGGFVARDTGIGGATDGLAGVRVVRPTAAGATSDRCAHDGELLLWFVIAGTVTVAVAGRRDEELGVADAVAIPPGPSHGLASASADLELLEVTLPAGQ